ncbi:hypothetical protein [Streptomyces sp. NPDC053560]|uniref:hypothetical protein n=1 Tax=Streptomyces sp. NPDC053560 TaxID=3365711 RepID=UPI0037D59BC1
MQWSTMAATALGAILGVVSTLLADRVRWRRELSERDRDALRASFAEYMAALAKARDTFSRAEPAQERIGKGHIALGEHGVYAAQHWMELVASQSVVEKAHEATSAVLDFYDVVVTGHDVDSTEYRQAWRAARDARRAVLEAMRAALGRP